MRPAKRRTRFDIFYEGELITITDQDLKLLSDLKKQKDQLKDDEYSEITLKPSEVPGKTPDLCTIISNDPPPRPNFNSTNPETFQFCIDIYNENAEARLKEALNAYDNALSNKKEVLFAIKFWDKMFDDAVPENNEEYNKKWKHFGNDDDYVDFLKEEFNLK